MYQGFGYGYVQLCNKQHQSLSRFRRLYILHHTKLSQCCAICKTYIYILQTLPEPSVWVTRLGVSCPYEFKIQSSLDSFFTSVSDFRNMSYRTMDCLPATSYNYSLCGKFGILSLYFSLCPRSLSPLFLTLLSLFRSRSHDNVRNMTNYTKNHIVSKNIEKTHVEEIVGSQTKITV